MPETDPQTIQRYADLVDSLPIGVYVNTPGEEGHFLEANAAMIKMFEANSKEDFLKHSVVDLYQTPEDRKKFSDKMLRQGFVTGEELVLKTLKGRPIWGSVTAVKKTDEKGNVYFDGTIEDITERKNIEEDLKIKIREVEKLNNLMVGRELKMAELKEKIAKCKTCAEHTKEN